MSSSPQRTQVLARGLAGAAATVNIGLHVWLTPMHLDEMFYVGVLFCVGNAALLAGLLLLLTRRGTPAGWLLLAATAVVEFALYVASRTVGLPGGYLESWTGELEDTLGLISLVTDIALVVSAALCLRLRRTGRSMSFFEPGMPDAEMMVGWRPLRISFAPIERRAGADRRQAEVG